MLTDRPQFQQKFLNSTFLGSLCQNLSCQNLSCVFPFILWPLKKQTLPSHKQVLNTFFLPHCLLYCMDHMSYSGILIYWMVDWMFSYYTHFCTKTVKLCFYNTSFSLQTSFFSFLFEWDLCRIIAEILTNSALYCPPRLQLDILGS